MEIEAAALRAYSASLLALSQAARSAKPHRLMHDALMALRPLVPFRSAWWGECSDSGQDSPRRNWLHGRINLGAGFAQEWNRLAEGDVFARDSMRNLGQVVRDCGYDDPSAEVAEFSRRHALAHAMAITVELPGSGLMFFVSLYRGEAGPAFSDAEAILLEEFTKHLLHHWRTRVQDLLRGVAHHTSSAFGLTDEHGELLYLDSRLGTLLHKHFPGWSGSVLPADLVARLGQAPCAVALGRHQVTLQPCGELLMLSLERGGRASGLPPRERSVAMLYAQGRSYKEIAQWLGLSPATVRTYLRSAYLHLGVRNKIELAGSLRTMARPRG